MPVMVETHAVNQGLGATIRDGLLKACELADPHDVLVTLDADNTHTPELILRMVRTVREGLDVVVASRYRPGSRVRGVPLGRRILSRVASVVFRVLFPIKGIRDYTCGYRAYRAGALQSVIARSGGTFFEEEGFQVMVDILLKLRRDEDLIFGEVPLILRYDLKEGASKMDVGRTVRRTLSLVIRRLVNRD
jgi:dolichol-phosphate mannosyltransferase